MLVISRAVRADAEAILALQKLAYASEARIYNDWSLPPLTQTIGSLLEEFGSSIVLIAVSSGHIVGSVRATAKSGVCLIGRLVVHPDFQGKGIGSRLLREIENDFPGVSGFELFTGSKSEGNIRLYQRHGYSVTRTQVVSERISLTYLHKVGSDH